MALAKLFQNGAYRAAYHPVVRRHIYATAAGVHRYRHWR